MTAAPSEPKCACGQYAIKDAPAGHRTAQCPNLPAALLDHVEQLERDLEEAANPLYRMHLAECRDECIALRAKLADAKRDAELATAVAAAASQYMIELAIEENDDRGELGNIWDAEDKLREALKPWRELRYLKDTP